MPISPPAVSRNAPPAKPSCIGAVVRITWSIARRRPVGSGPPITETMPALAVTTLLHERATASARWPTRGAAVDGAIGGVVEAGDAQHREAGRRIPAGELRVERRGRRRAARAGRPRGRARAPSSAPRCQRTRGRWPAGGAPAPGRPTAPRPRRRRRVDSRMLREGQLVMRRSWQNVARRRESPKRAGSGMITASVDSRSWLTKCRSRFVCVASCARAESCWR